MRTRLDSAAEAALEDAGGVVGFGLMGHYTENGIEREDGANHLYRADGNTYNLDTAAVVWAALESCGWYREDAEYALAWVHIEIDADELANVKSKAGKVEDPWVWLGSHLRDTAAAIFREKLRQHAPVGRPSPATKLRLDGAKSSPRWIIPGKIARGRRTILTGDQSAAKSTYIAETIAAGLLGRDLLGDTVDAKRFMLIDGEQDAEELKEMFGALGLRDEHLDNVLIFASDSGFPLLGTPEGNARMADEVEDFRPDLIWLDTTLTTTAIKGGPNDNAAVATLYMDTFNPIMRESGAALCLSHHERKSGASGDRSEAAAGARQWTNQVSYHLTLATAGKYSESPTGEDGHLATRRAFVMRNAKVKSGGVDVPLAFEMVGEKDRVHGATLSKRLVLPREELSDAEQLAAACDGEISRQGLAEAVTFGGDGTGKRFVGALDEALDGQLLHRVSKGVYAPGDGRA